MALFLVPAADAVAEGEGDSEAHVAEIDGGGTYGSLADAVSAASDRSIVRLVADDADSSAIPLDGSITIDGQGHSFSGTFILDRSSGNGPYAVVLNDIVFLGHGSTVSTGASGTGAIRSVDLTIDGCTFSGTESGISVTNASAIRINDTVFENQAEPVAILTEGTATSVDLTACTFSGSVRIEPDSEKGGSIGSLAVYGNTFPEGQTSLIIGVMPASASFSGVSILFGDDRQVFKASVPSDYILTVEGGRTMRVSGTATFSGILPEGMTLYASGLVGLDSFTGKVLLDSAGGYSLTLSDSGPMTVDTLGMVIGGDTGSGEAAIEGTFLVDSDLAIGSSLMIPEGSRLNIASGARVSGGNVSNSGYIDLYGILSSDVYNGGRIMAHNGSSLLGDVQGNPAERPIPAVVTTVVRARVGDEVRVELSPSEGTEIDGIEGPDWLSLADGILQGVPLRVGTYSATVYASSDEYSITMAYEFVISSAATSGNGGWNLGLIVAVFAAMFIAIGLLTLRWMRG